MVSMTAYMMHMHISLPYTIAVRWHALCFQKYFSIVAVAKMGKRQPATWPVAILPLLAGVNHVSLAPVRRRQSMPVLSRPWAQQWPPPVSRTCPLYPSSSPTGLSLPLSDRRNNSMNAKRMKRCWRISLTRFQTTRYSISCPLHPLGGNRLCWNRRQILEDVFQFSTCFGPSELKPYQVFAACAYGQSFSDHHWFLGIWCRALWWNGWLLDVHSEDCLPSSCAIALVRHPSCFCWSGIHEPGDFPVCWPAWFYWVLWWGWQLVQGASLATLAWCHLRHNVPPSGSRLLGSRIQVVAWCIV